MTPTGRRRGARLAAAVAGAALAGATASGGPAPSALPKIALIIDDVGYRYADGVRAARLPGPIAVAILPQTPHTAELAAAAAAAGKEILLHLPMQPLELDEEPGPGALTIDQDRDQLAAVLAADLAAVPLAMGISNHMGSLLTADAAHMTWFMAELRARGNLFFVDSYTAAASVALEVGRAAGVPALRRDVFLDSDPSPVAMEQQWQRLLARARARGTAIAIGHPRAATLELLERVLPTLAAEGVELVPLTALLPAGGER